MTKQEMAGQLAKEGTYILKLLEAIGKDRETIMSLVAQLLELKANGSTSTAAD